MKPAWRVALGGLLVVLAAACGIVFDAPNLTLIMEPDGIVYASAGGDRALTGGETVVEVRNSTEQERQVVLALVDSGAETIPEALLAAENARDDDRILGFSRVLEPEEVNFGAGGVGRDTDGVSFHVHLRPGDLYVLFDALSGGEDGVVLWLRPGEEQEQA